MVAIQEAQCLGLYICILRGSCKLAFPMKTYGLNDISLEILPFLKDFASK